MEGTDINWIGIILFSIVSIGSIVGMFFTIFLITERKNPMDYLRKKDKKSVNSGAKFG